MATEPVRFGRIALDTVAGRRGDGSTFEHERVTIGRGVGGIVVAVRDDGRVAVVTQPRVVLGYETVELPRGGTDDLSSAEACRELVEETGLAPVGEPELLGIIAPDTGTLTTRVAVWRVRVGGADVRPGIEHESCARASWAHPADLLAAAGRSSAERPACSMSLAALALHLAS